MANSVPTLLLLLLCAGLCEWKSKYLLVGVVLRYTPTSILPSSLNVLLVSRKAMLFLPIVVVIISTVKLILAYIEFKWL